MKFSIIYEAQTVLTDPETEFRMFHDIVDQCLLAEKVGFDVVWAVEHTALPQYAHMSAPETFLAFIAGKTDRLEIGHGVVCLPPAMNHPVPNTGLLSKTHTPLLGLASKDRSGVPRDGPTRSRTTSW